MTIGGAIRVGTSMWMLSGCLVTDQISFPEEEQFPPTIVDVPGTEIPIGGIFWVDLDKPQNEWELPVRIRDDNVDEELTARHRILKESELLPAWTEDTIAPSGVPTREDYKVKVPFGELRRRACHRVELVVSGSFVKRSHPSPKLFDVTEVEDDIARASWTILEGKGVEALTDDKALLLDSCETIETFLETPP